MKKENIIKGFGWIFLVNATAILVTLIVIPNKKSELGALLLAILIYSLLCGIGLLLRQRWAYYLIVIIGMIRLVFFLGGLALYIAALRYGNAVAPGIYEATTALVQGFFSLYLFKHKDYFKN